MAPILYVPCPNAEIKVHSTVDYVRGLKMLNCVSLYFARGGDIGAHSTLGVRPISSDLEANQLGAGSEPVPKPVRSRNWGSLHLRPPPGAEQAETVQRFDPVRGTELGVHAIFGV